MSLSSYAIHVRMALKQCGSCVHTQWCFLLKEMQHLHVHVPVHLQCETTWSTVLNLALCSVTLSYNVYTNFQNWLTLNCTFT